MRHFWGIINHKTHIMKHLILITAALLLVGHTLGYSQTTTDQTITNEQTESVEANTQNDAHFIGTYMLEEAGFELEIIKEDNKMYIVTEFSKDVLIQKNDTTLHEITRGVDLELIEGNRDALKFTQNGYETTIKRVKATTEK